MHRALPRKVRHWLAGTASGSTLCLEEAFECCRCFYLYHTGKLRCMSGGARNPPSHLCVHDGQKPHTSANLPRGKMQTAVTAVALESLPSCVHHYQARAQITPVRSGRLHTRLFSSPHGHHSAAVGTGTTAKHSSLDQISRRERAMRSTVAPALYLGLDFGTSGARAAVIDGEASGRCVHACMFPHVQCYAHIAETGGCCRCM